MHACKHLRCYKDHCSSNDGYCEKMGEIFHYSKNDVWGGGGGGVDGTRKLIWSGLSCITCVVECVN